MPEYDHYTPENVPSGFTPEEWHEVEEGDVGIMAACAAFRVADIAIGRAEADPDPDAHISYGWPKALLPRLYAKLMFWVWLKIKFPLKLWWKDVRAYMQGYRLAGGEHLSSYEECLLDFTPDQKAWIKAATKAYLAKYKKAAVASKDLPLQVDFTKLGLPPFPRTPPLYRRVFRHAIAAPVIAMAGFPRRLAGLLNWHGQHAIK